MKLKINNYFIKRAASTNTKFDLYIVRPTEERINLKKTGVIHDKEHCLAYGITLSRAIEIIATNESSEQMPASIKEFQQEIILRQEKITERLEKISGTLRKGKDQ